MKTRKNSHLWVATTLVLIIGVAAWSTWPQRIDEGDVPTRKPDASNGELVFWAGGCASCHATPVNGKRAKGDDKLLLGGGLELDTPYGVFRAPNISPSTDAGIGQWSDIEFVNAMQRGVSPDGRHYYPSFPYTSYAKMAVEDILDLKKFLDSLPAIDNVVDDHALRFPWSVRRGIGAWKRLYLDAAPVKDLGTGEALRRGQYLVEGAGHCGECHSPRNRLGALRYERWLAGAPNLDGAGQIPNITPAGKNTSDWSSGDLVYYFESGFTPDFDTAGGSMVAVQENLSQLPKADLEAIALYLQAVPAVD